MVPFCMKNQLSFRRLLALIGLAATLGVCPIANAADGDDPFQMDSGHWMAFDRYNDNVKRHRPVGGEVLDAPPAVAVPTLGENGTADTPPATTTATATEQSATPTVAAPTRPLNLPILPGVNRGYGIQVNSTAEDSAAPAAQIVENSDGTDDLHFQKQNWQDAAEVARKRADEANGLTSAENESAPLDVRMSYLPNTQIKPEPGPGRPPRQHYTGVIAKTKKAERHVDETAKQQTPAECAAVDLYKKKQLEAIQSDRQTLQALQSAISDLGLQKELDFMTGAQNNVSPQAASTPTNATPSISGKP